MQSLTFADVTVNDHSTTGHVPVISIGAIGKVGDVAILCGGHSVGLIMVGEPLTVDRSVTSELWLRSEVPLLLVEFLK